MVLDGHDLKKQDALDLVTNLKSNSTFIFQTAKELRNTNKGNVISFSKKSFFNIINLCRDTCSYCTYKSEPNESKISMMEPNNVVELAKLAKKYHCTEALFVTGERPEDKYELARDWLKKIISHLQQSIWYTVLKSYLSKAFFHIQTQGT